MEQKRQRSAARQQAAKLFTPKLGTTMPEMGIATVKENRPKRDSKPSRPSRSLADALFSSTQQRVLGLLFGQPARSFFATEIIGRVGAGSGAVQRELKKLTESGLVTVSWIGNQKHYQANKSSPIFTELCAILRKTVGLVEPLRQALQPAQVAIELALVYGSVAARRDRADSDVDLLLVSDQLTLEDVYRLLEPAEQALGRTINPTLYARAEFERRRAGGPEFLQRVLAADTLILIGELPDD